MWLSLTLINNVKKVGETITLTQKRPLDMLAFLCYIVANKCPYVPFKSKLYKT